MIYKEGYAVISRYHSTKHLYRNKTKPKDIFIIKPKENKTGSISGVITIENIIFPQNMIGKRIRIKIEPVTENNLCQGIGCNELVNNGKTYCDSCFYMRLVK